MQRRRFIGRRLMKEPLKRPSDDIPAVCTSIEHGSHLQGGDTMISDLEARVSRKLMLRIIPFVALLYFISFLDRVNVGFAAMTMNKSIGLSPTAFGLGGGLFFIGYFLFEVPSNLILNKVGARVWIARVMVTWGMVSAASAFVVGP